MNRDAIALQILCALLSNPNATNKGLGDDQVVVGSYALADKMIHQGTKR